MSTVTDRPQRPYYWLGAIPASKWVTRRRILAVVVLGGITVILLVALAFTQSVWVLIGIGITVLLGIAAWSKTDAYGGQWLSTVIGEAVRSKLARAGGWDEYHPEFEKRPWLLQNLRVAGFSQMDSGAELCLMDASDENAFVAVLEIDGDGEGIRPMYQHRRIEGNIGRLLNALCDPRQVPSQVDFIVRSAPPVTPSFKAWTAKHLRDDVTDEAESSMRALADEAERRAGTLRAWVAIRMPIEALADRARLEGRGVSPETLAELAYEVTGEVTRMLRSHEVTVLRGLSVRQVAAVVRGIMLPHHDVDSTDGIGGFWDAWPAFQPSKAGEAVIAYDPSNPEATTWRHSSAVITRDGFPDELVEGRWLEPVVLESPVSHRVVVTQFGLIPHREARLIAKDQLTAAQVRLVKQARLGATSTGENEDSRTLAQAITRDITRYSNAGVVPIVRVMVSARTPRALRAAREDLAAGAVERGMHVKPDGLKWQDGRQTPALLRMLPLGMEVPRP